MALREELWPFDSQPQELAELTRSLHVGWLGSVPTQNLAGSPSAAPSLSSPVTVGKGGFGLTCTASEKIRFDAAVSPGAYFDVLVVFENLAATTGGILAAGKTNFANANGFMFESKTNANTLEINGGDVSLFPTIAAPGLGAADGKVHALVVSYRGTTVYAAMDGAYLGSATIAAAGTWPSGMAFGGYAGANNANAQTRNIYFGAVLPPGDPVALSAAPWSLFSRRICVPVSAGGGSYSLTAEQGSYTLTGQAAGLLAGRVLAAAQGSYTLSGQDAALLKGNTLTADQGSYALTGQDVGLLRGLLLSAAQGSYALSGQDATLTYTPLGAYSLAADQGIYTLTGQSASLLWGPVLAAGQGSYALTGQDVTLTYTPVGAYILTAGQGSYALTGQDVLLQWGHVLAAAQGSYTLTGQAATLSRGIVLAAAQGSYTLTGQAAAFARTYVMSAGYGSYALTGQIVSLTYSGAALEALEYLLLISHITQSMSKTSKVTMEVDLISRIQQQLDGSSSI